MGFFDTLGRVKTRIVFWFLLIVLLIVLVGGVISVVGNHHTESANGSLTTVHCIASPSNNTITYQCAGQIGYAVDQHSYALSYMESGLPAPRPVGDPQTVYYDPKNPGDASTTSRGQSAMVLLIVSGILLLAVAIAYFRYEMSMKNTTWATGEGVLTGVNVVWNLASS